jgi:hypothetical protein
LVAKTSARSPHPALVHDPGQAAGAGQDAEQRHLGQRHRRRPVVEEQDALTGERDLVPAAGRGAVHRGDVGLAGVLGGVLDAAAGLVGELAEVHLPGVAGGGEHADVRPGAEDLLVAAGDDDGAHLGVLEPQPLRRVVQLDVDAQVIGVELQLVTGPQPAALVDVHHEVRDVAVELQPPVAVEVGARLEGNRWLGAGHRRLLARLCRDSKLSSPCVQVL